MIRKQLQFTIVLFILASVVGCHRQKLEEIVYTKALLPVLIDWETGALLDVDNDPDENLYSSSVWLFPRAGSKYQGAPLEYRLGNAVYDYLDVPIGVYDVLVFNKTVGEYSENVGFRGTDKFDTFEYYTEPYLSSISKSVEIDGLELRCEPDLLAVWRSSDDKPLEVTYEMIMRIDDIIRCRDNIATKYLKDIKAVSLSVASKNISPDEFNELDEDMSQLVNLVPERLTHIVPTRMYVNNIHSAKLAIGVLKGMSSSVKLASAEYSTTQTAYRFSFTSKTFTDDEKKNGYMDAEYRIIGPLSEDSNADYELQSSFTLFNYESDEDLVYPEPPADSFKFNVNSQIKSGREAMGLDKVIPVEIDEDENVTLPDIALPGGGFDVDLNDWDDEIDVPI